MAMFRKKETSIGLYVDYENIRQTLEGTFSQYADPYSIGSRVLEIARTSGNPIIRNVYGDWNFQHNSGRGGKVNTASVLSQAGFNPINVPVKASGGGIKDRTDIWLSLDALEGLLTKQKILGGFFIVSGDGDYSPLINKIRAEGKEVTVCGFSVSMSRELMAIADKVIFLENVLELDISDAKVGYENRSSNKDFDWVQFFAALEKAENLQWAFVGLKRFRDNWMTASMGISDSFDSREILNIAIREKFIDLYYVDNPRSAGNQTAAIKLNKEHPMVVNWKGSGEINVE